MDTFFNLQEKNLPGKHSEDIKDFLTRVYSLSTYINFPEKLTFLTPWYAHIGVHIKGKKCYFFGKFCARTKWMIPLKILKNANRMKFSPRSIPILLMPKAKVSRKNLFRWWSFLINYIYSCNLCGDLLEYYYLCCNFFFWLSLRINGAYYHEPYMCPPLTHFSAAEKGFNNYIHP